MTQTSTMTDGQVIARLILDWFDGERRNHGYDRGRELQDEIDCAIAEMHEPLPMAAAAWKQWTEYESRTDEGKRHFDCMELCRLTEWAALVELGLTADPYEGCPRIVINPAPETATQ